MHSNQFHRTRVAAAIAGVVLALGAGQAFGASVCGWDAEERERPR